MAAIEGLRPTAQYSPFVPADADPAESAANPAPVVAPRDTSLSTPPPAVPAEDPQAPSLPADGAPVRTPQAALPLSKTFSQPVQRLDSSYFDTFTYSGRSNTYPAALSVIQIQRGYNRLVREIAENSPELVATYLPNKCGTGGTCELPPLTVDGLIGPNTNAARQLLFHYLRGEEPSSSTTTQEDWAALESGLAGAEPQPWFNINIERGVLDEAQRNAAMVLERLAHDDPKRAWKLLDAIGFEQPTLEGHSVSREMVDALVERMASIGVPLTDKNVTALYERDPSGLGGVTTMRAFNVAELILEENQLGITTHDAIISEAVDWIREIDSFRFASFARRFGGDEEAASLQLAALIKAVMSAESDFDRANDLDTEDVGLMQLIPAVVSDYSRYVDMAVADDAERIEAGDEPRRSKMPVEELPAAYPEQAMHPVANTAIGGALLLTHLVRFDGSLMWTSAAYNKGPSHPDTRARRRVPNYFSTHIHTARSQRRTPYYLNQLREAGQYAPPVIDDNGEAPVVARPGSV